VSGQEEDDILPSSDKSKTYRLALTSWPTTLHHRGSHSPLQPPCLMQKASLACRRLFSPIAS
jgi:hypothetical protein